MTTSVKNNFLPPSLISNLQQVLIARNDVADAGVEQSSNNDIHDDPNPVAFNASSSSPSSLQSNVYGDCEKEIVLVTNGEGIESSGLTSLVEALVRDGRFNVHVCAPQSDRSVSGHSVTIRETLAARSIEISGVTAAYEVSGTPADCVSLALSGALFSWTKPALVISGINRGSSCGHNMFYSGAVAAAREALICGVPSLCISLNWKDGVSCENDLKDAANVCLPLLYAAIRDIKKGNFPKTCLLNVEIPTCPIANKGFKVTRQSAWRSSLRWQAVAANRHPSAGNFMSNQQSLGMKLAQLSRDASAAGAARRFNSHRKNVEIESVGIAGKVNPPKTLKKYFRLELSEKEQEDIEEDLDFRALENGFVAVTPCSLTTEPEIQNVLSNWMATALATD
ncbi:hypothetical protein JCGZ_07431 [Jatropha curcas]|uniref:Survival protein SurE-like phosphatase/nucleotidase domain-containing protein n=1 Tax=Jatropha curcas TaxID=180498 RepID=A0A067KNJ9_JATCU|nr:5'-nucleotidase SurE [Jatropha curcas]KDP33860.1 hypothetical protein JCGZ_07431 [Jatropha curcas]